MKTSRDLFAWVTVACWPEEGPAEGRPGEVGAVAEAAGTEWVEGAESTTGTGIAGNDIAAEGLENREGAGEAAGAEWVERAEYSGVAGETERVERGDS